MLPHAQAGHALLGSDQRQQQAHEGRFPFAGLSHHGRATAGREIAGETGEHGPVAGRIAERQVADFHGGRFAETKRFCRILHRYMFQFQQAVGGREGFGKGRKQACQPQNRLLYLAHQLQESGHRPEGYQSFAQLHRSPQKGYQNQPPRPVITLVADEQQLAYHHHDDVQVQPRERQDVAGSGTGIAVPQLRVEGTLVSQRQCRDDSQSIPRKSAGAVGINQLVTELQRPLLPSGRPVAVAPLPLVLAGISCAADALTLQVGGIVERAAFPVLRRTDTGVKPQLIPTGNLCGKGVLGHIEQHAPVANLHRDKPAFRLLLRDARHPSVPDLLPVRPFHERLLHPAAHAPHASAENQQNQDRTEQPTETVGSIAASQEAQKA